MKAPQDADSRGQILYLLKSRGPQPVRSLVARLGLTAMGIRQHLARLEEEGLVAFEVQNQGPGRPARVWRLTEEAQSRFPATYADLTLDLLQHTRAALGREGLAKVLEARTQSQINAYRQRMPRGATLGRRVAALARLRAEEGYMAESKRHSDGSFTLVENHCPICAAARICQGLCENEIHLFQQALGPGIHIERSEHILDGERRCAYRIRPSRNVG